MAVTINDPPYYAEGGRVWKHPIATEKPDGGRSISLGFPVCTMHQAVGAKAAEAVAELMNRGDVLPEVLNALKAVVAIADRKTDEFDRAHAAIAKAEGR